jgi:T-complex protein 1 subunit alpha
MGVQILITKPSELKHIRDREADITKEHIQKILASGANVILTTKGIDEMALKYFVEAGVIACRRVPREDMIRIAKATGAEIILSMADMEGDLNFDTSVLGYAEVVYEEMLTAAGDEMIFFKNCKESRAITVLLRGATQYMLDEIERSLHDALSVIKRVLEGGKVVAGGGAVEVALSIFLENFATTLSSREQLAIMGFASALLIIPKTLAVNAARDATELLAKLRACHYTSQLTNVEEKKSYLGRFGLDLINGATRDNVAAGVLEPAISNVKMIQFATEAAITILRIDDLIKLDANLKEP